MTTQKDLWSCMYWLMITSWEYKCWMRWKHVNLLVERTRKEGNRYKIHWLCKRAGFNLFNSFPDVSFIWTNLPALLHFRVHVILLLESVVFQKPCWLSLRRLAASKIMSVDVNLLKSTNVVTATQNYRSLTPCGDIQHSWSQPNRGCASHDVPSARIIFHYNLIWRRLVNAYLYIVQLKAGDHFLSSTSWV